MTKRFILVAVLTLALAAKNPSAQATQKDIAVIARVGILGLEAEALASLH